MIAKILWMILLCTGLVCLGYYGFVKAQAHFKQKALEEELYEPLKTNVPVAGPARGRNLKEGELFGRLEIPRLNLSVMVMEGDRENVLRLGAGHVPGTSLAIAGHRDSFFRPLKDIKVNDVIRFTNPEGSSEYRVVSTKIVGPKDTWVLDHKSEGSLMLITCYPFYYIGHAPKRFIVEAMKN